MEKATRPKVKKLGLDAFSGSDRAMLENLLTRLGDHGLFFVGVGELEGWLSSATIPTGDKAKWVVKMFEHMGANPQEPGYSVAGTNDVWEFLTGVKAWIDHPRRRGIPA